MHFAFGVFAWVFLRVRRRIALLRTCLFVVRQFIAHQLPIYFFTLHQTEPAGPGSETVVVSKIDTYGTPQNRTYRDLFFEFTIKNLTEKEIRDNIHY